MFIGLEQSIINKNFVHNMDNNTNLLSFQKINDALSQINLNYDNEIYTFSFPINHIHFTTKFKDKKKLLNYINYILHTHKF